MRSIDCDFLEKKVNDVCFSTLKLRPFDQIDNN